MQTKQNIYNDVKHDKNDADSLVLCERHVVQEIRQKIAFEGGLPTKSCLS